MKNKYYLTIRHLHATFQYKGERSLETAIGQ